MNEEKTIYDDEKKEYQRQQQETTQAETKTEPVSDSKRVPNKKPMWQRAAIGAGTGFAAGVAATVLTSGTTQEQALEQEQDDNNFDTPTADTASHPSWVDGEVSVATSVNDEMSFGEAFAAARAEVGAGGVFEWHGGIYNTYYEDEWVGMSATDRAEFGSHFSWNDHHNDIAATQHQENTAQDEVPSTVVEMPGGDDAPSHTEDVVVLDSQAEDDVIPTSIADSSDHEVEILGVVHDDETGINIGGMMIDGHEAVVLDVDGDMTFDIVGVDMNDNHEFEENEQANISSEGLTVDAFSEQSDAQLEQTTDDYNVDAQPYDC